MMIESLSLQQFRNYKKEMLTFSPRINVLYGDNAQGKTNILEAVNLCSTTRSHRGSKDKEMILFGCEEAHIQMEIRKKDRSHKIDFHLKKNKAKGIAIDRVPIRKSKDLMGVSNVVFFSPENLSIIERGPEERRNFMDVELCQLNPVYLYHLSKYRQVLKQRNQLLKQISSQRELLDTLDVWDQELIQYGSYIIKERANYIEEIREDCKRIHQELTNGEEEMEIRYEPNTEVDDFEKNLLEKEQKDLYFMNTSVGPHRDDLEISCNGISLRTYGSRGQKRTAALSMKLTEIEIVQKKIGEKPILLLDDVFSELDRNRQTFLLKRMENIQTLITCTGLEEFIENEMIIDKIFHIRNGNVVEEKQGGKANE